MIEFLKT